MLLLSVGCLAHCRAHSGTYELPEVERDSAEAKAQGQQDPITLNEPANPTKPIGFEFVGQSSPGWIRRAAQAMFMVVYKPTEDQRTIVDQSRLRRDRLYLRAFFMHQCIALAESSRKLNTKKWVVMRLVNPPEDRKHVGCLQRAIGSGFLVEQQALSTQPQLAHIASSSGNEGVFVSAAHVFANKSLSDFVLISGMKIDDFGPPEVHQVRGSDGKKFYSAFLAVPKSQITTFKTPVLMRYGNLDARQKSVTSQKDHTDLFVAALSHGVPGMQPLRLYDQPLTPNQNMGALGFGEGGPLRMSRGYFSNTSSQQSLLNMMLPLWPGMSGGPTLVEGSQGEPKVTGINIRTRLELFDLVHIPTQQVVMPQKLSQAARHVGEDKNIVSELGWRRRDSPNAKLLVTEQDLITHPEIKPYMTQDESTGKWVVELNSEYSVSQNLQWLSRMPVGRHVSPLRQRGYRRK